MSIRSEHLLLALLLALAGCGADVPEPAVQPLVAALADPDPAVRRQTAERLGALEDASREVIDALLWAQYDGDESVSAAALAALDRIHPAPEVALRVYGGECYEDVGVQVIVQPATTAWRRVACDPMELAAGDAPTECWTLVEVPPVYETRTRHVLTKPGRGFWRPAKDVEAGDVPLARGTPPPPTPRPATPPEGAPAEARQGEVWCGTRTSTGIEWRRARECEGSAAPR